MAFLETLVSWDTTLFLFLNGKHSDFFDVIMNFATQKLSWIPLYLFLLIVLIKKYKSEALIMIMVLIILITLSDQLSSFIKAVTERLRPCHNVYLASKVHLVVKNCGGQFGFVSGHACNSFALAAYLSILTWKRIFWMKYVLTIFALLVTYSRIYVGVHYPGDVICGALLGFILGFIMAKIYIHYDKKSGIYSS